VIGGLATIVSAFLLSAHPAVSYPATAAPVTHGNPAFVAEVFKVAPHYRIDPRAALGVARMEGWGGGVGDYGTSFGPWQLHAGGSLPRSVYSGPFSAETQEWAWSAQGIEYALKQMRCAGAGAYLGYAAVYAIVTRFERPLYPIPEVAGAWRAYPTFRAPKPKHLTPTQKLRARHGYIAWRDWSLGIGPWRHHRPFAPKLRPHVRRHIPKAWWRRRATFVRKHPRSR
jgi:hypothetical protein